MKNRDVRYLGRTAFYDREHHRRLGWKIAGVMILIFCIGLLVFKF